eukprot:8508543-Alexandrium_andersonii.AAC.1
MFFDSLDDYELPSGMVKLFSPPPHRLRGPGRGRGRSRSRHHHHSHRHSRGPRGRGSRDAGGRRNLAGDSSPREDAEIASLRHQASALQA